MWVFFSMFNDFQHPSSPIQSLLCVCVIWKQTHHQNPHKTQKLPQTHILYWMEKTSSRFRSEGAMKGPCEGGVPGSWLSGGSRTWECHACTVLMSVCFLFVWLSGGAGASASSGESHSGILRECQDSEKWQLLPLCEWLLLSLESGYVGYCLWRKSVFRIYPVSEAVFVLIMRWIQVLSHPCIVQGPQKIHPHWLLLKLALTFIQFLILTILELTVVFVPQQIHCAIELT